MSEYSIITNGIPREMHCLADLLEYGLVKEDEFDYLMSRPGEMHQPRLVEYKGHWYDVIDTQAITTDPEVMKRMGWSMKVTKDSPFAKWDFILSESYFSGVVFKITTDDRVICGRYYS